MTEDEARAVKRECEKQIHLRGVIREMNCYVQTLKREENKHCSMSAFDLVFEMLPSDVLEKLHNVILPVMESEMNRLIGEADAMPLLPESVKQPYKPML